MTAPETGTTEDGEAGGMSRRREGKNKKTAPIIVTLYISYTENSEETAGSQTLSFSAHAMIVMVSELECH